MKKGFPARVAAGAAFPSSTQFSGVAQKRVDWVSCGGATLSNPNSFDVYQWFLPAFGTKLSVLNVPAQEPEVSYSWDGLELPWKGATTLSGQVSNHGDDNQRLNSSLPVRPILRQLWIRVPS